MYRRCSSYFNNPTFGMIFILVVVSTEVFSPVIAGPEGPLRLVILLFRHGSRAPAVTYPNDPHQNYPWVGGLGALQPEGIHQGYQLGQNFAKRYQALLPPDGYYTAQRIHAVSSSVERSVMTAQAVLAGLLKPQNLTLDIPWQPASILTIPIYQDSILVQQQPCPKYSREFKRFLDNPTPEFRQTMLELKSEMEYVTKHSGAAITELWQLAQLYDALLIQRRFGLKLPAWTNKFLPERALRCVGVFLRSFTATPIMKRLRGGATFTEFIKIMKSKQAKTLSPDRSVFIYSGHDSTQVSLLDSMGMLDQTTDLPEYASTVAFELLENTGLPRELEIRMVYYRNSTVENPEILTIPGCSAPCPLNQFEKLFKGISFEYIECSSTALTSSLLIILLSLVLTM
ncbi:lysosomal acid phosphatase-like [Uranotaenia lowii]|uniref:lysosomal acid phosphatase-like n=1 Tax=Uranotaenia lowii TaxID=190385 RepID=UPI00247B04D3|nr:lysosomal acid phosphatase-like [Uranotaenia lowii]XP_055589850.1 lysosomal acid phosphatase-like [Uranotaenia lowii]XP_055589854.1 lysosomal acid phosphatase-like [Uranotaenia lowii]